MVFATHNQHKLDEIREITKGRLHILGLADLGCREEIEETGRTLEENALIKARFVNEKYGYACFADDSGLEVEALDGAPGVYSSRYAGNGCNPADNMDKLLSALQGIENRAARFRTAIALTVHGKEHLFEGVIKGRIIDEKRGIGGFGYDPVFIPDGYDQTFAELGTKVKNMISHRALAVGKLVGFLIQE